MSTRERLAQALQMCLACERPLPPRGWWQLTDWWLGPPKFCPSKDRDCWPLMMALFRRIGEPPDLEGGRRSGGSDL